VDDRRRVFADFSTEERGAHLREDVKYRQHDHDEVVEGTEQVLECLENYTHRLYLIQQGKELHHADENDHLTDLDRVIVLLEVTTGLNKGDGSWDVHELAEGLGPDAEVVAEGLDGARYADIADGLQQHRVIDGELEEDPGVDLALRR